MKLEIYNDNLRQQRINQIKRLIKDGRKLYIYGAGETAQRIVKYLREYGVQSDIYQTVDDKYANQNTKIVPFSRYIECFASNSVLIIGFYDHLQAKTVIKAYEDKIKYIFEIGLNHESVWEYTFFEKHYSQFLETFNMLYDDKSRNTMNAFINASICGDLNLLDEVYESQQYFNELLNGAKIDVLLDCGAYDGDSIHDYIAYYPQYKEIFAMEPDPDNVMKMQNRIKRENIHNINVISKGAYNTAERLRFKQSTTESNFSNDGEIIIDTVKIDDIIPKDKKVSLIKMDIEGNEVAALEGARRTIQRDQPCLAVCVYHKIDDLIKIPKIIQSLVEKKTYHYYLRYHGKNLTELVFYAISCKL